MTILALAGASRMRVCELRFHYAADSMGLHLYGIRQMWVTAEEGDYVHGAWRRKRLWDW